jgi:site-specific recombinase XerD
MKIEKPDNFYIETNLLENRYVTNGNIWTVDETSFNEETKLFLVVSLKTRTILGYIQGGNCQNEDMIIELYKRILDEYEFSGPPCVIHSDMEPALHSKNIREFLGDHNVHVSITKGVKYQNQVSEAVNSRIKYLVAEIMLEDVNSWSYRKFKQSLPEDLKPIRLKIDRCRSKEYKKHLFQSEWFKSQQHEVIQQAIIKYNKTDYSRGISREEAHYYDSFIESANIDNINLVSSEHVLAQKIKNENLASIKQVQTKIAEILKTGSNTEEKIAEIMSLMFQRQDQTDVLLQQGFIGLSIQNQELKEELEIVTGQLQELLKQQAEILEKRRKRKDRKRLPQKDPLTRDIYDFLIKEANLIYRDTYQGVRLRIALAILTVTGVRISELLPLKVNQIQTLMTGSWIAIDRLKRGPSNHKAFLTQAGRKIMRDRRRDFEIIIYAKEDDSFVFTPQYSADPLERSSFTKLVNGFLKTRTEKLPSKPNITSHSFRIGFITELWKDTKDIEFVRQAIGHAKIETTSRYVQNLSAEEREQRMINLESSDDLFY